jgi:ferric-dicitrate binding protein FerR (iron transport regulator)
MSHQLIEELTAWMTAERKTVEMMAQHSATRYAETDDPDHKQDFKQYQALSQQLEKVESKVRHVLFSLDHLIPKAPPAE